MTTTTDDVLRALHWQREEEMPERTRELVKAMLEELRRDRSCGP